MKLHPLQQQIVSAIEFLPTASYDPTTASLTEYLQIRLSETVTGLLRRFRRGQPIIWDPWLLKDGDTYRMFYLNADQKHDPWWAVSRICGAVSKDLIHWHDLGVILEANPANVWEAGRVCAGCTYFEDGVYYLFYSAGGRDMPYLREEGIGLAVSTDGVHFSRYSDQPLVMPTDADPWYGKSNWTGHFHFRDPYLYKDEESGKYYLFICASAKGEGQFQGCVGLAVSDRVTGPYQILPPVIELQSQQTGWQYYHMERPQVIHKNGKYHLFFSCFKQFFNPDWLQSLSHNRVTNSSLFWYVSDQINGIYKPINGDDSIVIGSEKTGMYGTNFLEIAPEQYLAYGWYHRLHTLEVSPRFWGVWQNADTPLEELKIVRSTEK
jgi:beta-fructofuranosidase